MREFIQALFLHFFIMMIIPLVYNMLYRQRNTYQQFYLYVTLLITIFFTMAFPITLPDQTVFNLKIIPVFIGYLYIGPLAGILSVATILLIRCITFWDTSIAFEIVNYVIILVILARVARYFRSATFRKKALLTISLYSLIQLTRLLQFIQTDRTEYIGYLFLYAFVSCMTLLAVVYIMEMTTIQAAMLEKLQNADKLNAISQLAASVAHEIRNPMTTIRGFLQLIHAEENLTSKQKTFITLSITELERTQHIISDFLDMAKPKKTEYSRIHVSEQLLAVIDFMNPFAVLSDVVIRADVQEHLYIHGNANELKQLLINICKNGIESMQTGGTLVVSGFLTNEVVTISIVDSGSGMSQRLLSELGQPYYSTKTKGTGLGLMISFDIIKRMGGHHIIESEESIGTRFTIQFPAL